MNNEFGSGSPAQVSTEEWKADGTIREDIAQYLSQLAPHVAEREAAKLLKRSLREITQLTIERDVLELNYKECMKYTNEMAKSLHERYKKSYPDKTE